MTGSTGGGAGRWGGHGGPVWCSVPWAQRRSETVQKPAGSAPIRLSCHCEADPIAMARSGRIAAGPAPRHRPFRRDAHDAPVAQLDRAPDYESGGQEFESLRARQTPPNLRFSCTQPRQRTAAEFVVVGGVVFGGPRRSHQCIAPRDCRRPTRRPSLQLRVENPERRPNHAEIHYYRIWRSGRVRPHPSACQKCCSRAGRDTAFTRRSDGDCRLTGTGAQSGRGPSGNSRWSIHVVGLADSRIRRVRSCGPGRSHPKSLACSVRCRARRR